MTRTYIDQAGSFECVVEAPEAGWFGEAGENNTPFIRIPVVVTEGEDIGKCQVWRGWLSDKAFDNTIARLTEVFGFNGDLAALEKGTISFAGMPCNITTEIETYEGKPRCKVAWLNAPGGGGIKPMDAAKVGSLITKLASRAKAIAKATKTTIEQNGGAVPKLKLQKGAAVTPAPKAPAAAPAKPEEEEDDVPF